MGKESIYAHMEKTQRDTKPRISRLIMDKHEKFVRSLRFTQDGLDYIK
jgi:hypothetical protein